MYQSVKKITQAGYEKFDIVSTSKKFLQRIFFISYKEYFFSYKEQFFIPTKNLYFLQRIFFHTYKESPIPTKNNFSSLQRIFFPTKNNLKPLQRIISNKKQYKNKENEKKICNFLCILMCAHDANLLDDENLKN